MGRGRGRAGRSSRVGTFLFAFGCLTVLGVAFAAGALADRYWLTRSLARPLGAGDLRAAERRSEATERRSEATERRADAAGREHTAGAGERATDGRERKGARRGERAPIAESPPKLTFYEELTAPLAPSPLPPRPAKPERTAAGSPAEPKTKPGDEKVERVERSTPGPARFTVQLGAFRSRPQAEAMRASLTGAGHEAYVSPIDGPDGPRYRVRVGSFVTREEARRAAARLEATRVGSTYVTVR